MKQPKIRKRLFLLVGIISICILFVQCPRAHSQSNIPPAKFQKSKKELLRVRQVPSRSAHYVEVTVHPPSPGTELSQFTLTALNLVGHGTLFAAADKPKGKLKYKISLTKETELSQVYVSKGSAEIFKQGKPIMLRCRYQPEDMQPAETHQVQISVCAYDSSCQLLEHTTKEVSFLITQLPKPKEPKVT